MTKKYCLAYIDKHDQMEEVLYTSDSLVDCIIEWDDLNYTLNDNVWFFEHTQAMDIYQINSLYSWLYKDCVVGTDHANGYN